MSRNLPVEQQSTQTASGTSRSVNKTSNQRYQAL